MQKYNFQNFFQNRFSTAELAAEMENLDGLMKDLTSITQQQFGC